MISQLDIENFQSHKKTTIFFSNGVNVITGTSDSGKSSILRSLLWVLDNRPSGDSIINWDAKSTTVKVRFGEKVVKKERKGGKSSYTVDGTTFSALKQDVPHEVSDLFNMSDVNIQTQHDPYFLLNDSPGEVARRLNEIVGIDIIDTVFKNIDHRIRSVTSAIQMTNADIQRTQAYLDETDFVDKLWAEALDLQDKEAEVTDKRKISLHVSTILETIEELDSEDFTLINAESDANELAQSIAQKENLVRTINLLTSVISSAKKIFNDLAVESAWIECEILYDDLMEYITARDATLNQLYKIKSFLTRIEELEDDLIDADNNLVKLSSDHTDLLMKLGECPFCHSPMSKATAERIMDSL